MKKTDVLTIVGLLMACGLMLYGMQDGGTNLMIFFSVPSLAITFGGSLGAVLIVYPIDDFKKFGTLIVQSFKESKVNLGSYKPST